MDVITIRVQEQVAKQLSSLVKALKKPQAEVVRELIGKAVREEHIQQLLQKYKQKEITLRTFAKEAQLPLWKVYELTSKVNLPYGKDDLQQDLRMLEEL